VPQDEIGERLARSPVDIPDIHPNVADVYHRKIARLADALNHPEDRHEATAALRGLIERVVLTPGGKRGELYATLHGELGTVIKWVARTTPAGKDAKAGTSTEFPHPYRRAFSDRPIKRARRESLPRQHVY
jgi:hypothetical protein